MPVSTFTTSAAGSLNLLEDDDKDVRVYALNHLLQIVPQFWAEISDKLQYIELLADPMSKELPVDYRPLAALLIAKTYFYIGELSEAVEFSLKAGSAFDDEPAGEFRETIIAGCLDLAIYQVKMNEPLDSSLWSIVDGVLRSSTGENGKLAIGLALSLRRLDLIEMIYLGSRAPSQGSSTQKSRPTHDESLLRYVLSEVISGASSTETSSEEFNSELFELLLRLFQLSPSPDYNSITTIWIQDPDQDGCADGLAELVEREEYLEAYQIGFDLWEGADQGFVEGVRLKLQEKGVIPADGGAGGQDEHIEMLNEILRGMRSTELFLNFLNKHNKTDMSILKVTKESLEDRYSIYHSAITFTNAFAHCGTTSDKFLRENLDWLGRANNWAKFSTTAALGLIHRGSWINGIKVVRPYLPGGIAPSRFSEGGALFALGLIYAGRKEGAEEELRKGLAEGNDPIVQHGAALGLGVSGIATADEEIYEEIRTALFQDNATAGEAAGYAMGLIMLGTASEKALEEMISYARETQHEKIIRSLAVGIAFVMYGTREKADGVIKGLMQEKDSIMRYGAMYTIALAYAGTGSNRAVRRLLHVAVSDVNDDVRRAAVTALGFVLFRNYVQVPRIVQLLAESYNPHVRHGATLALGISCAGTGLEAAVDLLEPMTRDPVDFVRQGAYISLAMILIQQTDSLSPKTTQIRETFSKVVSDKHEDPMARFGASLAQGIIDAGGRNMTLSLSTRAGTLNMNAIVGMTLFTQFWYWYPLAHGLGLAFSPTVVIGLDGVGRVPKLELAVKGREKDYAYPVVGKKIEEKKKKEEKKAVLSTTAKARAREKVKKEEKGESMDTDEKEETPSAAVKAVPAKPRKAEPTTYNIGNMTRLLPSQSSVLSFPSSGRYQPIRRSSDSVPQVNEEKKTLGGMPRPTSAVKETMRGGSILLLWDTKEGEGEVDREYIELDRALWPPVEVAAPIVEDEVVVPAGTGAEEDIETAVMPQPFQYPFDE